MSKYVALFSSKGYAIGEKFAKWLAHKLKTTEALATKLIGHLEDLLAICGGRDYIFFLDAAVVERFAQIESLYGFLLEEADLGAKAGGKLRNAILTGFKSGYCMAAVRSLALIADAWLWPMLRAIEPGDDVHILDVCPALWPRCCAWLEEAAADPASAIDGSLCLRSSLEAAGLRVAARREPSSTARKRSERAATDLERIRGAIAADDEMRSLVHEMLSAAFTAMAKGVRNHAEAFMPGGACCTTNITPALRKAMSGTPITSVPAETVFARAKHRVTRCGGGRVRSDTLCGATACNRDATHAWGASKRPAAAAGLLTQARKRWRGGSGSRTLQDERALSGAAEADERAAGLAKVRGGRAKKAAELERIKLMSPASTYSALKSMGNDDLREQLKYFKLVLGCTGFVTNGSGEAMRLQLQSLIFDKCAAPTALPSQPAPPHAATRQPSPLCARFTLVCAAPAAGSAPARTTSPTVTRASRGARCGGARRRTTPPQSLKRARGGVRKPALSIFTAGSGTLTRTSTLSG